MTASILIHSICRFDFSCIKFNVSIMLKKQYRLTIQFTVSYLSLFQIKMKSIQLSHTCSTATSQSCQEEEDPSSDFIFTSPDEDTDMEVLDQDISPAGCHQEDPKEENLCEESDKDDCATEKDLKHDDSGLPLSLSLLLFLIDVGAGIVWSGLVKTTARFNIALLLSPRSGQFSCAEATKATADLSGERFWVVFSITSAFDQELLGQDLLLRFGDYSERHFTL